MSIRQQTGPCHFIVNPGSGSAKKGATVALVGRCLAEKGCRVEIHTTTRPGHATWLASQLPEQTSAVIVVGGDGTVREVSQGLIGRNIPLSIFPTGTENLVAKQFHIRATAECLVETLLNGVVREVDVGQCGDRIFLIVTGIGFDAEVVQRLTHSRTGHISRADYFWPIWRAFWEHQFPELTVEADGELVFEGKALVIAGSMPRYGIGLRILAGAVCDDGKLDLCIYPCRHPLKLLLHAARTALRQHRRWGDAMYLQAKEFKVTSPVQVPVQLDGDNAGHLPAHFQVLPRALRLLVPQAESA